MSESNKTGESDKKLSAKEFAKQQRKRAYAAAKERRKNDPRLIAMKERLKVQRREQYQKMKIRAKDAKVARKKTANDKADSDRAERDKELMGQLIRGDGLEDQQGQ